MKRIQNIIHALHGWPEEARQLLAVVIMVVASVAVFSGWSSIVSSRLTPLSGNSVAVSSQTGSETLPFSRALPQQPPTAQESTTVLSPLGGIVESVKGLAGLVAKIRIPSPLPYLAGIWESVRTVDAGAAVNSGLDRFGRFLYEMTK